MSDTRPAAVPVHQRGLRALRKLPLLRRGESLVRRWMLGRNLRRLHDALEQTPFAGRYWLFCGALLGWAREGRLLAHDFRDVDLAYDAVDHDQFLAAIPAILAAGFRPAFRYRSNDGTITEHSFFRQGAKFEFFRLTRVDDQYRYHVYGSERDDEDEGEGEQLELVGALPAQPREPIKFLGRTWLKSADHGLELETMYGDWRTPDPGWSFLDDRAVVERLPWRSTSYRWDGES